VLASGFDGLVVHLLKVMPEALLPRQQVARIVDLSLLFNVILRDLHNLLPELNDQCYIPGLPFLFLNKNLQLVNLLVFFINFLLSGDIDFSCMPVTQVGYLYFCFVDKLRHFFIGV
jgi:hypothetical protein